MQKTGREVRESLARVGRWIFWAGVTAALVLIPRAVSAGTIKLAWDPVSDPDVSAYRVYYGTTSGVYGQHVDVGKNQTSATLSNLQDCTVYYMAVKAVDANFNESASFSNEISGISAPILTAIAASQSFCMGGVNEGLACSSDAQCIGPKADGTCTNSFCRGGANDGSPCTSNANCSDNGACSNKAGRQGANSLNVTVTGTNFDTQARPDFGPDVTVNTWSSVSCNEVDANITISDTARVNNEPAGPSPRLVSVINVYGSPGGQGTGPIGSQSGLFTVLFDHQRADIDRSGEVFTRDVMYMMQQNYPFNPDGSPRTACVSPDPCYDGLKGYDLNGDGIVADGRDVSLLASWYVLLHM